MVGYGGKLDYRDQPTSIKTKQDQPRSNQGQLNENQSLALIALALFDFVTVIYCKTKSLTNWATICYVGQIIHLNGQTN